MQWKTEHFFNLVEDASTFLPEGPMLLFQVDVFGESETHTGYCEEGHMFNSSGEPMEYCDEDVDRWIFLDEVLSMF